MKRTLTIYIFILFSHSIYAQIPGWQWVKSRGGNGAVCPIKSITKDNVGNVYIAGYTNSTFLFFNQDTILPSGGDFIVAKYDANGNEIWARSAWGFYHDEGEAVAIDQLGYVYVTGWSKSHYLVFGQDTIRGSLSNPNDNIFIIKFDSNGNYIWGKGFGGFQDDHAKHMAVDPNGNVILCGTFLSDSIFFDSYLLTRSGVQSIFIIKLDLFGHVLRATSPVGTFYTDVSSVFVDQTSNIYVTGTIDRDHLTFDTITLQNQYPNNQGFIVKYDQSLSVIWAKSTNGPYNNSISVISGNDSSIYVSGKYQDSLLIDNDTLFDIETSFYYNEENIFIAKYNYSGSLIWTKTIGGKTRCNVSSLINLQDGNILFSGYYTDNVYITPTDTTLSHIYIDPDTILNIDSLTDLKLLFYSFNDNGVTNWIDTIDGTKVNIGVGGDEQFAVTEMPGGEIAIADLLSKDSFNIENIHLPNSRHGDWFVAKTNPLINNVRNANTENRGLMIVPNPSSGSFRIIYPQNMINPKLRIFDLLGNKIFEEKLNQDLRNYYWDVHLRIKPGVYLVNISDNRNTITSRFVIY